MIQVIYTPEADYFCLGEVDRIGRRVVGDPVLEKLKGNYAKLREEFPNLPQTAGVVSYNVWFKREARKMREEVDNKSVTYLPLAILEQLVELSKLDLSDPMNENYFYRAFARIISHPAILNDNTLAYNPAILFGSNIPVFDNTRERFIRDFDKVKGKVGLETGNFFKEAIEILSKFPKLADIEEVRKKVEERFQKNKVSRGFPLYYMPDIYFNAFNTVNLSGGIETPDFVEGMLKYIKLGCEAQGLEGIPENVQREIDSWSSDRFGETKIAFNLEELLSRLPEPKTIITDCYIVDKHPEIAELGFESHEFKLE